MAPNHVVSPDALRSLLSVHLPPHPLLPTIDLSPFFDTPLSSSLPSNGQGVRASASDSVQPAQGHVSCANDPYTTLREGEVSLPAFVTVSRQLLQLERAEEER